MKGLCKTFSTTGNIIPSFIWEGFLLLFVLILLIIMHGPHPLDLPRTLCVRKTTWVNAPPGWDPGIMQMR